MSSSRSSEPAKIVRNCPHLLAISPAAAALLFLTAPVHAQDDSAVSDAEVSQTDQTDEEPEGEDEPFRIDLTVTVPRGEVNQSNVRACEEEADAASISGDIIVCRQIGEDNSNYYSGSREDAQRRYAQETQNAGLLPPPDVAGPGIFKGPATVGGLCLIPPCPPEAALLIDVEALPEAPEGSDADRIARGLPPLGDRELTEEEEKARRAALGAPSSSLDGPD